VPQAARSQSGAEAFRRAPVAFHSKASGFFQQKCSEWRDSNPRPLVPNLLRIVEFVQQFCRPASFKSSVVVPACIAFSRPVAQKSSKTRAG
jgi:hypothetical protein